MLRLDYVPLMAAIGGCLLLAGYWLAAEMREATPAERLAAASLVGLTSALWTVATVNFFLPLRGFPAWLCVLLPCGLTLGRARSRRALLADCRQVFRQPAAWCAALGAAALLLGLLWPLLRDPTLVFYDGTGNHDGFFWIASAEHLQRHSYMVDPIISAEQPFTNAARAITDWQPPWGRMGAEGLLALVAALTGRPAIEIYHPATVALLLPWLSGVFLVLRTFVTRERQHPLFWFAASGLQPVFLFFNSNGNLPNLLGVLAATGMVLGVGRSLENPGGTSGFRAACWPWLGSITLSTHALLCGYPEMLPFAVLPCGLLGLRASIGPTAGGWRRPAWLAAAAAVGFALNPATSVRGLSGFLKSLDAARYDAVARWHNLLASLEPAEYFPALTTLAVGACDHLGAALGLALSLGLLGALALTIRRARDPFGTSALLAGVGALVLYTLVTGFSYGWQKAAQFAGIFLAALFPAGCLATLVPTIAACGRPGALAKSCLALLGVCALLVFFTYATVDSCVRNALWSRRKRITREMLALRAVSAERLRGMPVLVVSESFPRSAYFYGMWASYLLPDSALVYSARGEENGGYLQEWAVTETVGVTPPPAAILVSQAWATTFDANSPRLAAGAGFALLENTNRVLRLEGFQPRHGVPEFCTSRASLSIQPHRDARLHATFHRRHLPAAVATNPVLVEPQVESEKPPACRLRFDGPGPWAVVVPLKADVANTVTLEFADDASGDHDDGGWSFNIEGWRITDGP